MKNKVLIDGAKVLWAGGQHAALYVGWSQARDRMAQDGGSEY